MSNITTPTAFPQTRPTMTPRAKQNWTRAGFTVSGAVLVALIVWIVPDAGALVGIANAKYLTREEYRVDSTARAADIRAIKDMLIRQDSLIRRCAKFPQTC
jgi:hypothetical protein